MRHLWLVLAVAGCSEPGGSDVTGPFTGDEHRYAVVAIHIPSDASAAERFAADLDGDGMPENQFGAITSLLATTNDLSLNASDMIASGAIASRVEIKADDLTNDPTVGVRYLGAEGDVAVVAGGTLVSGAFRSNRTATTRVPGAATLRLPVYTNADPLTVELVGMELDLDPDGRGGFDAVVRGGLRVDHARAIAYAGLVQMFETEPARHVVFARGIDADRDSVLSRNELDNSVIALLVKADIELVDAPAISFAFGVHLSPCTSEGCGRGTVAEPCRDRVHNGNETDVDCGGSCQPCAPAKHCMMAADCQSNACDGGSCAAWSCRNSLRDGYESDVDCGGACGECATGRACADDADCATGQCNQGVATLGTCLP
ncbi:MAG: hypothetical protein SFX73_24630 [Kofleriaceae bacterium]|nr:hypothetical protein [Kofleriaceae bacterium]